MGTYSHRLSLSADHDSMDLSSLPTQLGMEAKRIWKAGDPSIAPNGRVMGGNRRYSFCNFELEVAEDLSKSIRAAIEKLRPHKKLMEELSACGVSPAFDPISFRTAIMSSARSVTRA